MEAVGVVDFAGIDPRPRPRQSRLPVKADIFLRFILDSTLDAIGGTILGDSSSSSITCSAARDGMGGLGELCTSTTAEELCCRLAAYLARLRGPAPSSQRRGVAYLPAARAKGQRAAASDVRACPRVREWRGRRNGGGRRPAGTRRGGSCGCVASSRLARWESRRGEPRGKTAARRETRSRLWCPPPGVYAGA